MDQPRPDDAKTPRTVSETLAAHRANVAQTAEGIADGTRTTLGLRPTEIAEFRVISDVDGLSYTDVIGRLLVLGGMVRALLADGHSIQVIDGTTSEVTGLSFPNY